LLYLIIYKQGGDFLNHGVFENKLKKKPS